MPGRHALAAETHPLGLEPQALFERRLAAQADFAAGAEHAVPRQAVSAAAEQLHYQTVMERIAGSGGHGRISGHAPARNAGNEVRDGLLPRLIGAAQAAAQGALQGWIAVLHTPQQ